MGQVLYKDHTIAILSGEREMEIYTRFLISGRAAMVHPYSRTRIRPAQSIRFKDSLTSITYFVRRKKKLFQSTFRRHAVG